MKKRLLSVLLIISLLLCACYNEKAALIPKDEVLFHFIDVGQGDCILVESEDTIVLIDTGTEAAGPDVYNYLKERSIKYIDMLILTHPHDDHIGGSGKVIDYFEIGQLFINGDSSNSYSFEKFLNAVSAKNITPEVPALNVSYKLGQMRIKFLSPEFLYDSTNDNSLVVSVEYGETRALFMGDAEKDVEEDLIKTKELDADILKIGHHGSRNASTDKFLRKVSPSVCVIQCGKDNSYGHPHEEVLSRLEKAGTTVFRTDLLGTVILHSDGKTVTDGKGNKFKKFSEEDLAAPIYIGNKKSGIYHTDTCPNLPSEKNRIMFDSIENAQESGYTPCGNCN